MLTWLCVSGLCWARISWRKGCGNMSCDTWRARCYRDKLQVLQTLPLSWVTIVSQYFVRSWTHQCSNTLIRSALRIPSLLKPRLWILLPWILYYMSFQGTFLIQTIRGGSPPSGADIHAEKMKCLSCLGMSGLLLAYDDISSELGHAWVTLSRSCVPFEKSWDEDNMYFEAPSLCHESHVLHVVFSSILHGETGPCHCCSHCHIL